MANEYCPEDVCIHHAFIQIREQDMDGIETLDTNFLRPEAYTYTCTIHSEEPETSSEEETEPEDETDDEDRETDENGDPIDYPEPDDETGESEEDTPPAE